MALYSKHPRYTVLLGAILVATLFVLLPHTPPPQLQLIPIPTTVSGRLQRAHKIYNTFLEQRKGLLRKFGPTPQDVVSFSPNVSPWPAYTVWDFFPASFNCPHEIERVGALGDGGKWVCGLSLLQNKKDCVIYSFGINHESSFESEVLKSTRNCEIWGYDYTVDSFGPEITDDLKSRVHFQPYTLGGMDGVGPDNSQMFTLRSLMKQNGHTHIDIIKMDIEGWEFETLDTILKQYLDNDRPLPFGQLEIELHVWKKPFSEVWTWWHNLEAAGLRPFWTEPNMVYQNYHRTANSELVEYSFLNTKGNNVFIQD